MYDSRQDASGPTARDWQIAAANRFPDQRLIERRRFVMQDDLVALVQNGRKRTTIRFDEHGLEYPASRVLPIYAVGGNQPHHEAAPAGEVVLTGLRYVRCGDLVRRREGRRFQGSPRADRRPDPLLPVDHTEFVGLHIRVRPRSKRI